MGRNNKIITEKKLTHIIALSIALSMDNKNCVHQ